MATRYDWEMESKQAPAEEGENPTAEDRVTFLGIVFRGWKAKVLTGVPLAAGFYQWLCDQLGFPTIKTLAGMTPMPWWGWLLLAQIGALYGLFEYVRLNAGPKALPIVAEPAAAPIEPPIQEKRVKREADITLRDLGMRIAKRMHAEREGATEKDVNFEIADKVAFEKVTVWGRFGRTAIKPLSEFRLGDMIFDFRKNELQIPNGWNMDNYTDVMFLSEEVDRIWPREEEIEQQQ